MKCGSYVSSETYDNMLNCSLQSKSVVMVVTSDFIYGIYVGIVPLYVLI